MDLNDYLPPEQERPEWYVDLLEEALRPYGDSMDVPWNLVAVSVWQRMTGAQRQVITELIARFGRNN